MEGRVLTDQGVEFEAIDNRHLEDLTVVAESLDSQWVPQPMLRKMMTKKKSLGDVARKRTTLVRSEYLRSLVNAKQVVMNRVYLYNNSAIFADFLEPGDEREAFKELLSSGAIVPWLLAESSPVEPPKYSTDTLGFPAWQRVSQEVRMRCLRLSWNPTQNQDLIRSQLNARFEGFMQSLDSLEPSVLLSDLELDRKQESSLATYLGGVAETCRRWSAEGKPITRESLYRQYVVAEGTPTSNGLYDRGKPFAGELKQLIDLRYHVDLPDALQRYPLTPIDSLRRTALQEWRVASDAAETTADEIIALLRQGAFSASQEGLYIESLGALTLRDIKRIRETGEWHAYIGSMERLLANPLGSKSGDSPAASVFDSYVALARVATAMATGRKVAARQERWVPIAEFVVEVAGAILSVVLVDPPVYKVMGAVSPVVGRRAAPPVIRFIVRGFSELGSRAKLASSIDLMRGRFTNAEKEWAQILSALSKLPRFKEASELQRNRAGSIEYIDELWA